MLQDALEVVREMRHADMPTKRNFVRTPQRFIKATLSGKYDDSALESMFVATQEYSERVTGLSLWVKKTLPWSQPSGNAWIPEEYGVRVGNEIAIIPASEIANKCIEIVKNAIAHNEDSVAIPGDIQNPPQQNSIYQSNDNTPKFVESITINATNDTLETLSSIKNLLESKEEHSRHPISANAASPDDGIQTIQGPIFLDSTENIDATCYSSFQPRSAIPYKFSKPVALKTTPKPYQLGALEWLAKM